MGMTQQAVTIRFGAFELDPRAGELRKFGTRIKLQQQPFQILQMLVEHPGEVITREAVRAQLWPDDVHVDFENAINSSIRKLRDALGDKAENPRFVETLARRGYRFIAPVEVLSNGQFNATKAQVALSASPAVIVAPSLPNRRFIHLTSRQVAFVIAALALIAGVWAFRTDRDPVQNNFKPVPLTTFPGAEIEPSFSPDGTRVVFAWNGPNEDNFDIYIKLIGAGDPLRLTKSPSADRNPAWSPDGQWIAFLRELDERESAVMLIPALGGAETEITRVGIAWVHTWAVHGRYLAWSSDGKSLFVIDNRSTDLWNYRVLNVSIRTRERRVVVVSKPGAVGPSALAVSPDGKTLAYMRTVSHGPKELFLTSLTGDGLRSERKVNIDSVLGYRPCTLDWTPDGKDIVFSTCGGGIGRKTIEGPQRPVLLAGIHESSGDLAIARNGRLVYSQGVEDEDIWRLSLTEDHAFAPTRLISSTRSENLVAFSPTGEKIAFQSGRSGTEEIWICNRDGSSPAQLTRSGMAYSGSPQWSPDARTIAFDKGEGGGAYGIYTISSDGGEPISLAGGPSNNVAPTWSRDGAWIYFTSDRTGRPEVWKVASKGGSQVQVTNNGGAEAQESPDGGELYYKKEAGQTGALWKAAIQGGKEVKVLDSVYQRDFAVTSRGIYYINRQGKAAEIRYLDFQTGHDKKLASVFSRCPGFSLAPDGSSLLFAQVDQAASDLMLVENFR